MLPVPQDRMSGRRSSSIVSRTLLGRRASVYVTSNQQDPAKLITEINVQLALFRDLLIHIGQPHDCPELRERVRRLRRTCVEATKQTSQLVLPASKKSTSEGCADQPQLVLLYFMSQLLLRELAKCHRLVQLVPMDMTSYYENRAGPSNFGNVISQILLCKQITPDFNQEELCSIAKDTQEITRIVNDIQEYLPQHENLNHLETTVALKGDDVNGLWRNKRRGSLYKGMGVLCCMSRPNYL
ncbi:syntaxin-23 isoform X1 [Maniola jurtina]|uniref:syntaxin-23 isoform X1 n=1 Tax=Maniola jurtina TaxID=191418 RepID=UPI001E68FD58|nr:syntaxin-23 isoform X1 [Maniola jurtina]